MDITPTDGCHAAETQAEEARIAQRVYWTAKLSLLAEQRDRAAFSELFRYFAPRVKAYLIRLGLPDMVADELAQEAMLIVWNKAHLFKPERACASTWIFTLTRNLFIDLKRRERGVFLPLLEHESVDVENDTGPPAVESTRLLHAIDRLPIEQAQVVYLSFYEGCSHSEIAQQLGVPLGSVKSRMRLAFNKLRTQWA